jgi:hypothetical protein
LDVSDFLIARNWYGDQSGFRAATRSKQAMSALEARSETLCDDRRIGTNTAECSDISSRMPRRPKAFEIGGIFLKFLTVPRLGASRGSEIAITMGN